MLTQQQINKWYEDGQNSKAKIKYNTHKKVIYPTEKLNEERLEEGYRELIGLLTKY